MLCQEQVNHNVHLSCSDSQLKHHSEHHSKKDFQKLQLQLIRECWNFNAATSETSESGGDACGVLTIQKILKEGKEAGRD